MTLGYLLFEDPKFGYFASNKVKNREYWFLSNDQIKILENIQEQKPTYGSLSFEDTGYFIMREGWESDDKMMVISAGLDDKKPDHQHGDMLGIQAIANGHAILPNYQVRYSLKDFDLFKNSMVKNVALVDDELQGKQWTSNKGGSGFGKFRELPNPEVITWDTNEDFDLFVGRHDGFENVGVDYSHYTDENGPNLLRAVAPDATGHDILQLNEVDTVFSAGSRGKHWSVISTSKQKDFSFLTIIYPFKKYNNRLDEEAKEKRINNWITTQSDWEIEGNNSKSLSSESGTFLFNIKELKNQHVTIRSSQETDLFIKTHNKQLFIQLIGTQKQTINIVTKGINKILEPGQIWILPL